MPNRGGICLYATKCLKVRSIIVPDHNAVCACENLWITVANQYGNKCIIGLVYRSPSNTDFLAHFKTDLEYITSLNQYTIIMGDFNYDLYKPTDTINDYKDTLENFFLEQIMTLPTRVTTSTMTLIDHIWTSDMSLISNLQVQSGLSDHQLVSFNLNIQQVTIKQQPFKIRSLDKINIDNYQNDLNNIDWSFLTSTKCIDETWDNFKGKILTILDQHAPVKLIIRKSNQQPWMDHATKELIRRKNSARIERDVKRTEAAETKYRYLKKQVNKATKAAKKKYYNNRITINQKAPEKLWRIIKEVAPSNFTSAKDNDKIFTPESLNFFNQHFANVGRKIENELQLKTNLTIQNDLHNVAETSFTFDTVEVNKIIKIINDTPSNKATGIDDLPIRAIKMGLNKLAEPITTLINRIITEGIIPKELKTALTTPVYKKGDADDPNNYRPISVLPIISKVMEKVLSEQLYTYLLSNGHISSSQHGFKPKHSTVTCLLELTEDIRQELDKGKATGILALDLSKAFDTINHDNLLDKLDKIGIKHNAHKLLSNYLHERQQITKQGNLYSDKTILTHGVPQGSILGPLLFIVYINDIFSITKHCKILSYADDTTLYCSSLHPSNIQQSINEDAKTLTAWFRQHGLKVNAGKSQYMTINMTHADETYENIHITVDNTNILPENEMSILGVTMDKHMKWNKHVNNVIRNCKFHLRAFYRSVKLIDIDEKRLLYNACLASRLSYADIIWTKCNAAEAKKLQTIQNMAARAIMGCRKLEHAPPILKNLNWITLEQKRRLHELVMFHKIYTNRVTYNLALRLENYKRRLDIRTRGMGTSQLFIPAHRTMYMKKSFFIRNIHQWNRLPAMLKETQNTNTFKAKLFHYLFND